MQGAASIVAVRVCFVRGCIISHIFEGNALTFVLSM